MKSNFSGFPPEGIRFLRDLKKNNRREWFQPRKEIFESSVKAPMLELVAALNNELVKFAPDHVTDPPKALYRIYRDTRFSPDKTPYKTHVAANFPRRGGERHAAAGFYFHIAPGEVLVAVGVYAPDPEGLLAIRTHLAEHHAEFRGILKDKGVRKLLGELQGEQLSRAPKGFDPAHPAADLLRYKQWMLWTTFDPKIAATPKLLAELVSRFRAGAPLCEFLNQLFVRRVAR